jgi:hypothetical protein
MSRPIAVRIRTPFSHSLLISPAGSGCGEPTQMYYHVPLDWLKPYGNSIVLFDETGADPTNAIRLMAMN